MDRYFGAGATPTRPAAPWCTAACPAGRSGTACGRNGRPWRRSARGRAWRWTGGRPKSAAARTSSRRCSVRRWTGLKTAHGASCRWPAGIALAGSGLTGSHCTHAACGHTANADRNAALNILARGLALLPQARGMGASARREALGPCPLPAAMVKSTSPTREQGVPSLPRGSPPWYTGMQVPKLGRTGAAVGPPRCRLAPALCTGRRSRPTLLAVQLPRCPGSAGSRFWQPPGVKSRHARGGADRIRHPAPSSGQCLVFCLHLPRRGS